MSDTVDHYEAKQVAANLLRNGGLSADEAKVALDICNANLRTLARAYLAIADKELRTPGTVEKCAVCEGPIDAAAQAYAQPCPGKQGKPCPIKQVTNEKA